LIEKAIDDTIVSMATIREAQSWIVITILLYTEFIKNENRDTEYTGAF
jgi:hypothetical protein